MVSSSHNVTTIDPALKEIKGIWIGIDLGTTTSCIAFPNKENQIKAASGLRNGIG